MTTAPLSNLTATWNSAGTAFSAIKMNVTDTASAAGSLLMDLQVGGVTQFSVRKNGNVNLGANGSASAPSIGRGNTGIYFAGANSNLFFTFNGVYQAQFASQIFSLAQAASLSWESAGAASTADLTLARDAADTLAQRRGTNAQTFRIYNTFTDASNYERATVSWSGNVLSLGMEKAGTGNFRQVTIGGSIIQFNISGTDVWRFGAANQFIPNNTNNYDIGSTSNVVRNFYAGTAYILADGVAAPTATVGFAKIYIDTADGDLKIIFGDGTIKTIVTDT